MGIYGGFAGGEVKRDQRNPDPLSNGSVLSGDLLGDDDQTDDTTEENSCHVVTATGTGPGAVLDGFIVTGGNADDAGSCSRGGGIYIEDADPRLQNLFVWENSAKQGGGVYEVSSATTIEGCTVVANRATGADRFPGGGGMLSAGSSPTIIDSMFADNTAEQNGGGLWWGGTYGDQNLSIRGSDFVRNQAGVQGGGAALEGNTGSFAKIEKSRFISNLGGGLLFGRFPFTAGGLLLTQSHFWENHGSSLGGMMVTSGFAHVVNSTFAKNSSTEGSNLPGGLFSWPWGTTTVDNSVFAGNTGTSSGDRDQIFAVVSSVRTSCIEGLSYYIGGGEPGGRPRPVREFVERQSEARRRRVVHRRGEPVRRLRSDQGRLTAPARHRS